MSCMAEHFDIAIIGAGSGGYMAAVRAAMMGAKTAIIEKANYGGTCLNNGCVPSKALLGPAELLHKIKDSKSLGINIETEAGFDWVAIQKRKNKIIKKLQVGIKVLFRERNITAYAGIAELDSKGKIKITSKNGDEFITADNIIIATGSVPAMIPGWPNDGKLICTTDEALHWKQLPNKLMIVGGGVIGCEFACMMNEYGVDVTIVELKDSLLPEMDKELGEFIKEVFTNRGIKILTGKGVESVNISGDKVNAAVDGKSIEFDKVLVAVGRKPNTENLGLENVGIETERGFIKVNDKMETSTSGYYCIGDANGRCLLAHAASAQGDVAVKNALGQSVEQTRPVPSAVYTYPEIASVGITCQKAEEENIPVCVGKFPIGFLGKAMAVGIDEGFVKVIRHKETGKLLGVHIAGHNATEMIESPTAMMSLGASAEELAEMIFAHPTLSEAVKEAAEDSYLRAIHLPPQNQ